MQTNKKKVLSNKKHKCIECSREFNEDEILGYKLKKRLNYPFGKRSKPVRTVYCMCGGLLQ